MLKKIRLGISIVLFSLITFYFLDFAGLMSGEAANLPARIQFVPAVMAFSVTILIILAVLTLLFGRIYCSSICPMGIYQDIVAWFSKRTAKKKKRYRFGKAKNVLRVSMLVASVSVFLKFPLILGFIDPYSAYGRIVTNVFRPVYMAGNNVLEMVFTKFDNYTFYKTDIFIMSVFAFVVAILTLLIIGYLAWKHGRTYCNTVCPAGTVLGFLSRFAIFKIRIDKSKCNSCGVCEMRCKAACISSKQKTVDNSRCVDCFNCLNVCRKDALKFSPSFAPVKNAAVKPPVDEGKRRFLTGGIIAAVAAPVAVIEDGMNSLTGNDRYVRQHPQRHDRRRFRRRTGNDRYVRQHPILPPGSISTENMLRHCTSCHLCIGKCPSRVLKPAFMEYGLAGMMQPTMYFEKGFCNFDCTVCSEVCPNGAIQQLTKDEKHLNQGGHVVFTRDICIVQTEETNCGACSEHCPTQAVTMIPYKDGLTIPHINVEICIGCGGCEFICPVRPFRAIHIEGHAVQGKAKPFEEQEKEVKEIDSFGF
ncbi:MAG: 4Fe-4S dicluster domain-containing protein [Prevotellaceae bacterium]|jgi:polyferredoxin|nr:4Fe-4S dicluster domain-containing protein [Prevotellaceae bacterium]